MDGDGALEPGQVAEHDPRGCRALETGLHRCQAEPGADQAERRQRIGRFVGNVRHEAGLDAGGEKLAAVGVGGLAHNGDPGATIEMMRADVGDSGERIALRYRQRQRLAPNQCRGDFGIVGRRRRIDQGEIERTLAQSLQLRGRAQAHQAEMQLRPVATKLPQHPADEAGMHRALDITDGQPPGGPAGQVAAELLQTPCIGKQHPRLGKERLAFGIQMDALLCPLEQGDAKLRLELHDLAAQRRLRDMQEFSGTADIAGFGDGDEIAELAQVEHFSSTSESPVRSQL